MIAIISASTSPRLKYVCEFIFTQQFGLPYEILKEAKTGQLICYGIENLSTISIPSAGLLFDDGIKAQDIKYAEKNGRHFLFSNPETAFGYDIFSAIFYLISRYEEYLPHEKDRYGRYAHEQSIAYEKGFLARPLIDEWLYDFKILLQEQFPTLVFKEKKTKFIPTYDIDIAYSFLGKGLLRNLGGFVKAPSLQRIKVLLGKEKDPYDSYDFLDGLHEKYNLQPIYFFLLAQKLGEYDKNIDVNSTVLKALIHRLAPKYELGIHPSWQSYLEQEIIKQEKDLLGKLAKKVVTKSRQHYIKLNLPESYKILIKTGITEDYSMGYGTANGFRASTANAFYWFDLKSNEATSLLVHPFCFMDATSIFIDKKSATAAFTELSKLYNLCKKYEAPCVAIFHNNLLGVDEMGHCYESFLRES